MIAQYSFSNATNNINNTLPPRDDVPLNGVDFCDNREGFEGRMHNKKKPQGTKGGHAMWC